MTSPRAVAARARKVRLLVMDVDGVLTDGRMILSERGDELKAFHTHDGVAVALAKRGGLRTAMVTGESSPIAKTRGAKLGVDSVVLGARRKREVIEALCTEFDVPADGVAYIGDDLLDIPAMQMVGLAAFLWLVWAVLKVGVGSFRALTDPEERGLALGFVAGTFGLLGHALGANTFIIVRIMEPFWFFAAIVIALPSLAAAEATAPRASPAHAFRRFA